MRLVLGDLLRMVELKCVNLVCFKTLQNGGFSFRFPFKPISKRIRSTKDTPHAGNPKFVVWIGGLDLDLTPWFLLRENTPWKTTRISGLQTMNWREVDTWRGVFEFGKYFPECKDLRERSHSREARFQHRVTYGGALNGF